MRNLKSILFLLTLITSFSLLADDVVMATSEDLKEFDHILTQENQNKKPHEQGGPNGQAKPPLKPGGPPPTNTGEAQPPPNDVRPPNDGQGAPPDKKPNPRDKFEGKDPEQRRRDGKGDKNRPPNPFSQRPPPAAGSPGDGNHPPPPPQGNPPPPPQKLI